MLVVLTKYVKTFCHNNLLVNILSALTVLNLLHLVRSTNCCKAFAQYSVLYEMDYCDIVLLFISEHTKRWYKQTSWFFGCSGLISVVIAGNISSLNNCCFFRKQPANNIQLGGRGLGCTR